MPEGFGYQGDISKHEGGKPRGEPSRHLPPTAFVNFLQNHDQIGNRAFGERLPKLVKDEAALVAATAILMLAPSPPLLFMGEEWAAPEPFSYFCDFGEDLAVKVREGRKREFAKFARFAGGAGTGGAAGSDIARDLRGRKARLEPSHSTRATLAGSSTIGACSRFVSATSCR